MDADYNQINEWGLAELHCRQLRHFRGDLMGMNFARMLAVMKMETKSLKSVFTFKLEAENLFYEKEEQWQKMVSRKYPHVEFP